LDEANAALQDLRTKYEQDKNFAIETNAQIQQLKQELEAQKIKNAQLQKQFDEIDKIKVYKRDLNEDISKTDDYIQARFKRLDLE